MSAITTTGQLLALREAQQQLGGIGRSTLYRLIESGDLPLVKIRRRSFVRAADVTALIERAAPEAKSP